jgi:CheY-like chemotaxis protein
MTGETILFADNNSEFLGVRKEFLLRAGYKVLEAGSVTEAERFLRTRKDLDLAILDMRLQDDDDLEDRSGIALAQKTENRIPKIILTGFPTWQAAREALATDLNGIAPAVEIIDKREDPQMLLRAVDWILHRSELRKNIVGAFEVPSMVAIPDRISSLGLDETGRRLRSSFSETANQWIKSRDEEQAHAAMFHRVGLVAGILALLFVFAGLVSLFFGILTSASLPLLVAAVTQPISIFFFMREDSAYKRIQAHNARLDEINKVESLLLICDSLADKKECEKLKRKVVEHLLDHWLNASAAS